MSGVPLIALGNDVAMPQLGFGVFLVPPEETVEAVRVALATGYRLIDTAKLYGNEAEVGRAIADSGLPRDEVFVTTKVWNSDQGFDATLAAFDRSIERLGTDYVDLYLIHWPAPMLDRYVDTWRALERVYAEGRARAIGVSNFTIDHLERLRAQCDVTPMVNQVELHPGFAQEELRDYHRDRGIVTEAWSPLGRGHGLLDDPVVTGIAVAHARTAAQVVLRWHLQLGNVVIPKSVRPERIRENFGVFGFALTDDEMAALSALAGPGRVGPDPLTMNRA